MARQALMISSALGGKAKFKDFIRYHDEDKPQEMTPEAFAAMFGARKKDG